MSPRSARHLRGVVIAAALAVAGTAGCSGSDGGGKPSPSGSGRPSATKPVPLVGARNALTDLHCAADSQGSWSATGTLSNQTGRRARFALSFDVIDTRKGSVHGRAQKSYTLDAGARTAVKIVGFYHGARADRTCVPNVQQAPVA